MYPATNFGRCVSRAAWGVPAERDLTGLCCSRTTPEGGGEVAGFRPPDQPHTPHHHPGTSDAAPATARGRHGASNSFVCADSPAEYGAGAAKTKAQDVASKSLSGLESLVDQIPSIAEGPAGAAGEQAAPAPVAALPEYAPALYPPYGAYGGAAYPNNGYGAPFVGYGGGAVGWGGGLMRPTPGYLSEWQYGYAPGVPSSYAPYNAPYYNGYAGPPPAHAQQVRPAPFLTAPASAPAARLTAPSLQTHYLSAPPLIDLHKNGEVAGGVPAVPSVPSVGFGGFC